MKAARENPDPQRGDSVSRIIYGDDGIPRSHTRHVVARTENGDVVFVTGRRPPKPWPTEGQRCSLAEWLAWTERRRPGRPREHGHAGPPASPEYKAWRSIVSRCLNPNWGRGRFADYGGRGIMVCEKWRHSFEAFLSEVGPRPSPRHSIDRIDNDGNYEPGNVRWATAKEQCRNRRNNVLVTVDGATKTIAEWSEETGLNGVTIGGRLRRGWSPERAIRTPSSRSRRATSKRALPDGSAS